jgi:hypothetical protein
MHEDAISVILISVIACLVLAILILGSPEAAQLTPEQINLLPLWGPRCFGSGSDCEPPGIPPKRP